MTPGYSSLITSFDARRWAGMVAVLLSLVVMLPRSATAAYDANIIGTVTWLATSPSGLSLLILSDQPTSNGSCNAGYFDPPSSPGADVVSDAAFNRMYARALSAFTAGTPINVGHDNSGTCGAGGYIRV